MNTLKALGGAILAIVVLVASSILSSVISSLPMMFNVPMYICVVLWGILHLVITLLAVKLIYSKGFKLKPEEIGMSKIAVKPLYLVLAVVLPLMVCGSFFLFVKGEFVSGALDQDAKLTVIASTVYNCIAAPVVEEILFRGVMFGILKKRWNTAVAVIVPSVLFAAMHITEMEQFSAGDCIRLLVTGTAVGVLFSLIAVRTGSVWNGTVVHMVWNIFMAGGFLTIAPSLSEESLVTYVTGLQSGLVTGGAFGAESSVIALLGYVVAALLVAFAFKASAKHYRNAAV